MAPYYCRYNTRSFKYVYKSTQTGTRRGLGFNRKLQLDPSKAKPTKRIVKIKPRLLFTPAGTNEGFRPSGLSIYGDLDPDTVLRELFQNAIDAQLALETTEYAGGGGTTAKVRNGPN